MEVLPVPQVTVFVETTFVPWAGATPAFVAFAPLPVHPVSVWLVAEPLRCVQVTVRGDAEAMPPGIATAASDADPTNAAQTKRRIGR